MNSLARKAKRARQGTSSAQVAAAPTIAPDRRAIIRRILRGPRIQAKLLVGRVDDPAEREAERVAGQVLRMARAPCPRCAALQGAMPTREGRAGIVRRGVLPSAPDAKALQQESAMGRMAEGGSWQLRAASSQGYVALYQGGSGPVDDAGGCRPALRGIPPSPSNCQEYQRNAGWLPMAYVNNATCACLETPNSTTANCVREFLQRRLRAAPSWLKSIAAAKKKLEVVNPADYEMFVQAVLTPRIYRDHVDAYRACCCPSGPAAYPAWVGVTTVPLPCPLVGRFIRLFGSCHGTPGSW